MTEASAFPEALRACYRSYEDQVEEAACKARPTDGIFGTRTFNALVAFQTEANLDPDGVCGPKTWSALATAEAQAPMAPPTPDQVKRYRVTCEGVTWQQYREIMKICPLAEAVEESD